MVLDFPSITPNSEQWSLLSNTQTFTSSLNGATQTAMLPGSKWRATLTFANLDTSNARKLQAFLTSLRGRAGKFYLRPADSTRLGTATGTGVVSGGGQTGGVLVTSGWDPEQQLLFAAGDLIEVNGELKQVSVDVSSDVTGGATIPFAPDLHQSPPDGAQVRSDNPRVIMRLDDDQQATWSLSVPVVYAVTISCTEAIDV